MSLISIIKGLVTHPLGKKNKWSTVFRFLKWQVGSRLVPGDVVYDWVGGAKIVSRTGESGVTGNIYLGLHEFMDMAFLLHALRRDDVFVDVGANVGSYTVLAAAVVGAKTYCFEPVPLTYRRLMTNIRINELDEKVVALNMALGDDAGEVHFSTDENCMNHVIAKDEATKNRILVKVSTLDEEVKDVPFLIKIDVEGYETPALKGAFRMLSNEGVGAIIMELNGAGERYGYDENEILSMMRDMGYRPYAYNPFGRLLTSLEGKNLKGGNTIFIRDFAQVDTRVRAAPAVRVQGISI